MKVFITKYLFTNGIEEVEAERPNPNHPDLIVVINTGGGMDQYFHGEGREWHRTREGAVARAKQMQEAKIKSLEKSIAKIKKLKFE